MHKTVFLLKGIFLGFSLAAPVGPIGLLCIQRTLNQGRLTGFVSGLGATVADMLYGCVAAFGVTMISNFLLSQQEWLRLAGGIFICYLGFKIFLSRPAAQAAAGNSSGLLQAFLSTLNCRIWGGCARMNSELCLSSYLTR